MKPLPATTTDPSFGPSVFSSVKIVRHPRAKKPVSKTPAPPDEATLLRLNEMAKKFPFCILYREKDNKLL